MNRWHVSRLCGSPERLFIDSRPSKIGRCYRATRPLARLVGLLGTGCPEADEALLIEKCGSVHGVGMRHAVDCLFLDASGLVLARRRLSPGRFLRVAGARSVLEVAPGALAGAAPGARLTLRPWVRPPSIR